MGLKGYGMLLTVKEDDSIVPIVWRMGAGGHAKKFFITETEKHVR